MLPFQANNTENPVSACVCAWMIIWGGLGLVRLVVPLGGLGLPMALAFSEASYTTSCQQAAIAYRRGSMRHNEEIRFQSLAKAKVGV